MKRVTNKKTLLTCILTGQQIKQNNKQIDAQFKKLKFGSADEYVKYFIGKEARKLLTDGNSVSDIRKQYKCNNTLTVPFNVLKCYVKKFKNKDTMIKKQHKKVVREYVQEFQKGVQFIPKGSEIVDLSKNKEVCARITQSSCWRPDIFLDYGCSHCSLKENCACPIKDLNREPGDKVRKRK